MKRYIRGGKRKRRQQEKKEVVKVIWSKPGLAEAVIFGERDLGMIFDLWEENPNWVLFNFRFLVRGLKERDLDWEKELVGDDLGLGRLSETEELLITEVAAMDGAQVKDN